jgi:hypothetical protein
MEPEVSIAEQNAQSEIGTNDSAEDTRSEFDVMEPNDIILEAHISL